MWQSFYPKKRLDFNGPSKLREMIEQLGGTFVKFGQLLAMRPDIVSPPYIIELSRLLDHVPSFDGQVAAQIVQAELHKPLSELFAEFTIKPIAAASFAQVHRARLKSGELVAVKVQRPRLEQMVSVDLAYLGTIAKVIDSIGLMKRIELRAFADDFIRWTREELDFESEGTYIERMRQSKVKIKTEYIPKVYWEYSSRRVLTTEYLEGIWVSDLLHALETKDEKRLHEFKIADMIFSA